MYRSKIILLDSHFPTGEPTVQLISTWGRNGQLLREATSLTKTAAHSPAEDYIRSVTPEPGKSVVLVIGLGDHETYGPNRNGDSFPSEPIRGKIASDEVLPKHFKSYEKAHVFEHHVNEDPAKAIGKVRKAFWNPHMRRVEVVEDFDHKKAPNLLEKIASGEYPAKSMGCLCAGTHIHTPAGFVRVEDVALGDTVITHTGAWRAVTELHRRPYLGKIYTFTTPQGKTTATAEHPIAVLRSEHVLHRNRKGGLVRKTPDEIDVSRLEWVRADQIDTSMYVITPWTTDVKETLSVDQCRFLGYYCAEGNLKFSSGATVCFTHNLNDTLRSEMLQLAPRLGTAKPNQRGHNNSIYAMYTEVRSVKLAALCDTHVGRLAMRKRLSAELLTQPKPQQLAFLGAVINGDGGIDDRGDFYISTCNEPLAYQLLQIGFRCGIYGRIQVIRHKPSTVVKTNTIEYRVSFARRHAHIIAPYTSKVKPHAMRSSSTGPLMLSNCVLSRIKNITSLDFDGPVYNFEVEGDESYVADGHAVHNCRIKYDVCTSCSNKARTREEYCDHLKYAMSRIDPHSGVQNAALNPSPDFFDSSWVIRPADRTGFMLKKVAREHTYEISTNSWDLGDLRDVLAEKSAQLHKAADIEKIISGKPTASLSNLDSKDARLIDRYHEHCSAKPNDSKSPNDGVVRIMLTYKPSEALGTADGMGLPLGIKELIEYFLGRMSPELSKDLDLEKETIKKSASDHLEFIYDVFARYPRFFEDVVKLGHLSDAPVFNKELATKLAAFSPQNVTQSYIHRSLLPAGMRGNERGLTDTMHWTDPNTGQPYTTNYGTVQKTNDALVRQGLQSKALNAAPYLGASALLGGATLGMSLSKRLRGLPQLATGLGALATGAMGANELMRPTPIAGPKVQTDEGETISGWTEMVRGPYKYAQETPELAYVVRRTTDGQISPLTPKYAEDLHAAIKQAVVADELSDFVGPTLQLEKVAEVLGNSILLLAS